MLLDKETKPSQTIYIYIYIYILKNDLETVIKIIFKNVFKSLIHTNSGVTDSFTKCHSIVKRL